MQPGLCRTWSETPEGLCSLVCVGLGLIIIIIISIFKEDNVFSITASLPYGPPVNTDTDYYRTFFGLVYFLQVLRG